ncbi:MAG: hypothetical protein QOJ07_542 [Thermoleophilaceae bacterium]|nr:hypothetical protein [Thermoleophilaceae bacterium]
MTPGAYGLRLTGVAGADLIDAPSGWEPWTVERSGSGLGSDEATTIGEWTASVPLRPGGRLELDRRARSATWSTPAPLSDDLLAHPYLAPAAAIAATWRGALALHGGALVTGEGAWGLLGDAGGGKSSLLAALDLPVVADDLLVIEGGAVMAGPRCVDLREPAPGARRVEGAERERWRLRLLAVPAATPLAGFVRLEWGGGLAVRELESPAERLPVLSAQLAVVAGAPAAAVLLALAELPVLVLTRPRDRARLGASAAALLDAI